MTCIVFDAGALVALERGDRAMWTALKIAGEHGHDVLVPTTTVAQTWRRGALQARLAMALECCVLASFDEHVREIGELCGRTGTSDICDAHVAIVAARLGDVLYTSDPDDMERLLTACRVPRVRILRC